MGQIQRTAKRADDLRELSDEYQEDVRQAVEAEEKENRTLRTIDREMREIQDRIADREDRMIGVSDRQQHKALSDEIKYLQGQLSRLEDEGLARLDSESKMGEDRSAALAESDSQLARATEAAREKAEVEAREADRLEHIQVDLDRLMGMLPPVEKRHLMRLREKLPRSVVYLREGACEGCFHQLPVQEAINVKRGRTVVKCPSCLRYVVHRSWK
jgi:predicted  nucleic acid-binding Zn-ribbon protein